MHANAGAAGATLDYDLQADSYARHRGTHPGVIEQLIVQGRIDVGSWVLDVGCGTGNYARALAALTGCHISGIEPSAEMMNRARAATSWESLLQGRAERLPFPNNAFDLVMSTDVIHHVGDRDAYFRDAARVLRPGGRIVTVTDSHGDITKRRPLTSHFPETVAIELRRYPSVERLLAEMAHAGFVDCSLKTVTLEYELTEIQPYRDRAFSSLLLIDENAFQRGLHRLEADLASGPISCLTLYTLVWGTAPRAEYAAV